MGKQIKYAIVAAGAVLLASLVFIDFPTTQENETQQREGVAATTTTSAATSTTATTSSTAVQLKGRTIRATFVDTPEARAKGLSGRTGLMDDEGMLFVFDEEGLYSFWMKDMLFSIDIIWIATDGTIVDIAHNVSPDTYPASFTTQANARYVLELRAGWMQENNVQIGEKVLF